MPININEGCKARLKEKLAEGLAEIRVMYMTHLDYRSLSLLNELELDSILPERGDVRNRLEAYVSESPIFDFVYDELSQELQDNQKFNGDLPDQPLSEIENYQELEKTSSRLIETLVSLPWKYCFTFRLENEVAKYFTDDLIVISENIRIIKNAGGLEADFPLKSENPLRDRGLHRGLLDIFAPVEWDENAAYVQIFQEGFVGKWLTSEPKHRAIETFKSLLGLLISLSGLAVTQSSTSVISKSRAYIHRENGGWDIQAGFELEDDVGKTLNQLRIVDLDGALAEDSAKVFFIKTRISHLSKALKSSTNSEKIMLAGRWIFDSYCGRNELLSFIQTTVALEILLGEKTSSDQMGLSVLLANRCAYLIGKTHQQREEVLKDFKEIYDVRSKIVHRGKGRLLKYERILFLKLQWMANRVVQEEIEFMVKNV